MRIVVLIFFLLLSRQFINAQNSENYYKYVKVNYIEYLDEYEVTIVTNGENPSNEILKGKAALEYVKLNNLSNFQETLEDVEVSKTDRKVVVSSFYVDDEVSVKDKMDFKEVSIFLNNISDDLFKKVLSGITNTTLTFNNYSFELFFGDVVELGGEVVLILDKVVISKEK